MSGVEAHVRDAPPVPGRTRVRDAQVPRPGTRNVHCGQLTGAGTAGDGTPVGAVVACGQLPAAGVVAEVPAAVDGHLSERLRRAEVDLQVLAGSLALAAGPPGRRVPVDGRRRAVTRRHRGDRRPGQRLLAQ